jgi:hypothetical protein
MPQIHLGVYLTSGNETTKATRWALEVCLYPSLPTLVEPHKLTRKLQTGRIPCCRQRPDVPQRAPGWQRHYRIPQVTQQHFGS